MIVFLNKINVFKSKLPKVGHPHFSSFYALRTDSAVVCRYRYRSRSKNISSSALPDRISTRQQSTSYGASIQANRERLSVYHQRVRLFTLCSDRDIN
jgi:hypothetical protein